MYCPTCGSEERQLSQFCRACGTDLRVVRVGLERPDSITASAVSAREQISRALADKIRQMESAEDLKKVAEDVLPQLEKFLESPAEKRLRRIRSGVVTASAGLGVSLLILLASIEAHDLFPFISLGLIAFLIGLGMIINGLAFTRPHTKLANRSEEALAQRELDSRIKNSTEPITNELGSPDYLPVRPSVTEHTTHQLKPNKS
jgi:hypothetical protein